MAGLDPLTAREGMRTAREIISGRQVSYPIPYLLALFCALCVACLIVALFGNDYVRATALAIGSASFLGGLGITIYATVAHPELLRSERHQEAMRLLQIVGDKDWGAKDAGELAGALLREPAGEPPWKRSRSRGGHE